MDICLSQGKQYDFRENDESLVLRRMSHEKKNDLKSIQKGFIHQELNLSRDLTFTLEQFV